MGLKRETGPGTSSTCSAWGIRRQTEVNAFCNKFKSTSDAGQHGHQIDWNTKSHPHTHELIGMELSQDAL